MKHGFIKCAALTPEISVADTDFNSLNIISAICEAENEGAAIAVLPELCISGATAGDMFLSDTLLLSSIKTLKEIAEKTATLDIISVVGLPIKYDYKIFNCAAIIHMGEILGIVPKSNLTEKESRWFASALTLKGEYKSLKIDEDIIPFSEKLVFRSNEIDSFRFGVQIGTDIFGINNTADALCTAGAAIILNPAAIEHTPENEDKLCLFTAAISAKLSVGYVLSNAGYGESTTDNVFAANKLIAENGKILADALSFNDNNITISEIDTDLLIKKRESKNYPERPDNFTDILFFGGVYETFLTRKIDRLPFLPQVNKDYFYERTLTAAAYGLKKRMHHTKAKKFVLGISGGLDSTLALLICIRTANLLKLPYSDIVAVTMPCFGTSQRTKTNAEKLCENLKVTLRAVDIKAAVTQHFEDIGHDDNDKNVTYENSQARERTQILMDIANDIGGIVIGTGDLSEAALGFATYNGDHMSMYGVNASIPKTLIRSLTRYEAENFGGETGEILLDIVNTPVSPELLPPDENGNIGQVTEDLVGPYELHDFFIYNLIKNRFSPFKIYRLAVEAFKDSYTKDTVLKWLKIFLRRFLTQQFKRSSMPDGVQVTDVSLSPRGSLVMPSDIAIKIWLDELENL